MKYTLDCKINTNNLHGTRRLSIISDWKLLDVDGDFRVGPLEVLYRNAVNIRDRSCIQVPKIYSRTGLMLLTILSRDISSAVP
jgi:hypothetical protein